MLIELAFFLGEGRNLWLSLSPHVSHASMDAQGTLAAPELI